MPRPRGATCTPYNLIKRNVHDGKKMRAALLRDHDTVSMVDNCDWLAIATQHYKEKGFVFVSNVLNTTQCWHVLDTVQAEFKLLDRVPHEEKERIMADINFVIKSVEEVDPHVRPVILHVQDVFKTFMTGLPESDKMKVLIWRFTKAAHKTSVMYREVYREM
jgi:hypothetical protein